MNHPTETQKILKSIQNKFGYTLLEISQKIGMTEAMVSRWNNAKADPTRKNLEKLKALAEGSTATPQPGQGGSDEMQEMKAILHRIEASHEVLVQLVIAMAVGKAGKMPAYVKQIIQGKKDPGATGTHG